ncbi:MAG TPA: SRPBCC family protein [Gemmatimonadaceae bacterium]|nr:SRPBCC family protein [Gemmatimonadaceae bacterium]
MLTHKWIALAACGAFVIAAGCTKPGAELTVEKTVMVAASPAELWAFVGQWDGIANIAPVVKDVRIEGRGVGATRAFEANGARFVEKLEALEDGKSYTYTFVETPLPVEDYHGTIAVADAGGGMSSFTWTGTFKARGVPDEDARKALSDIFSGGVAEVQKQFPVRE